MSDLGKPDERPEWCTLGKPAESQLRDHFVTIKAFVRADGTIMIGRLTTWAVRDVHREMVSYISVVEDVTKQEAAEAALSLINAELERRVSAAVSTADELRASQARLQMVLRHAPMGVIALDSKGVVISRSGALADPMNEERDRVGAARYGPGTDAPEVLHALQRCSVRAARGESGSELVTLGEVCWELRFNPSPEQPGGSGVIVVVMDVTDRLRVARAERESLAKSHFVSAISHELRTPLNSILGFTQLIADPARGNLTDQQKHYLDIVVRSGDQLLALVNDLLDLSKVAAGKMDLRLESLRVPTLLFENCRDPAA